MCSVARSHRLIYKAGAFYHFRESVSIAARNKGRTHHPYAENNLHRLGINEAPKNLQDIYIEIFQKRVAM